MATPQFRGCQETCGLFGEASGNIVRFLGTEQHARKGEQSKGGTEEKRLPHSFPRGVVQGPPSPQPGAQWMLGWETQTAEVTALFSARGGAPTPTKGSLARLSSL